MISSRLETGSLSSCTTGPDLLATEAKSDGNCKLGRRIKEGEPSGVDSQFNPVTGCYTASRVDPGHQQRGFVKFVQGIRASKINRLCIKGEMDQWDSLGFKNTNRVARRHLIVDSNKLFDKYARHGSREFDSGLVGLDQQEPVAFVYVLPHGT